LGFFTKNATLSRQGIFSGPNPDRRQTMKNNAYSVPTTKSLRFAIFGEIFENCQQKFFKSLRLFFGNIVVTIWWCIYF